MKNTSTLILRNSLLLLTSVVMFFSVQATAQTTPQAKLAAPRITQAIDEANLVPMHTRVHPLARAEFDRGVVADSQPMNRILLVLKRSPEQQAALSELMDEQQTKNSPNYHAWLAPAQFGQQFGVADADIQKVTAWLSQKGFTGIKVSPSSMFIEFSGTAGLVRNAFHTEMHNFMVKGEAHVANVSVPQIPAALAPVVTAIHSLHNFRKKSFMHYSQALTNARAKAAAEGSNFTIANVCGSAPATQPCAAVGPADFAKIYNLPAGLDGTGQTIALVARSNVAVSDINQFGTGFGISNLTSFTQAANVVLTGPDPGIVLGDDAEATLDVEWSGAVAPKAKILLVVSDSQATNSILTDGADLSAFYIVQNNLAPIMSESFGLCEIEANDGFESGLWEQAAAQGITVMVSTGDNGSAGCDPDQFSFNYSNASDAGLQISGTASTPFNVAIGGTDFDDATNPSTYWTSTNTGTGLLSAKSYIPEITWNGGCASTATSATLNTACSSIDLNPAPPADPSSDLSGGSGGQSSCGIVDNLNNCHPYPKPVWQQFAGLTGMPADGVRDIPDVSLFAAVNTASNNFYVFCLADSLNQGGQPCSLSGANLNFSGVGGTSVSSPAFAGIVALVNQSEVTATRLKTGQGQGNINYVLYKLAVAQDAAPGASACNSSTGPTASCTFNDITKGNNSVPCVGSFPTGNPSVLGLLNTPNCSTQAANQIGVLVEPSSPAPFSTSTLGFTTTAGYDLATGLGSVNVTNLVANWGSVTSIFKPSKSTITSTTPATVTVTHGSNVTFNVTVAPNGGTGTPSGDVSLIAEPSGAGGPQFSLSGATLSNTGTASISTLQLPGGTSYPVVVHYAGDGTFGSSDSAPVTVTVSKENSVAQTTLFDIFNNVVTSAPYGGSYVLRVDVIGSINQDAQQCSSQAGVTAGIPCPTGTVTFTADGSPLNDFLNTATGISTNSALLNPSGFVEDRVLGSTGLKGGAHSIVASYAGDVSYNGSTAPALAITITPASTLTSVTANGGTTASAATGQNVTLVATVAGCAILSGPSLCGLVSNGAGPTGTVTFSVCGTAASCTKTVVPTSFTNANGDAFATGTLTTTFATTGVQTITATFTTADTNYTSCAAAACEIGSATVTVALPPSKVAFTVQPTNVAVSASITPAVQVSVEDSTGAVVTSATNPVTIAIGNNAGPGGVLGGTLTATPVNGVATFSNLSINKTGTGYTLTATATGLTSATSSAFNVTGATGSLSISYSPNPLVLSSTTGAAAPLTVTVTPSGGFTGQVTLTATAASLPPGVTCPNSPLTINIVAANPVAMPLNCQVTATSTTLTASNLREERMYDAKMTPPTQTIPPTTGGKGWWALSTGTSFAALFLMFLHGGRKKYRAALGLGLVCLLAFTLGCNGVNGGGVKQVATTTQMTVTNPSDKVNSGTAFTFSVTVTGGTPGGMAQLFDGGQAISTAGASATVSGGKATLTGPTTLSVGTHAISVHYLGDTTTLASQSGSLNLTVAGSSTIAVTTTPAATPVAAAINITVQ